VSLLLKLEELLRFSHVSCEPLLKKTNTAVAA
jgi:hypothetical protein